MSFRYDNVCFKVSEINRKFSFGNLRKEFDKNILEARKRGREEYLQQQVEQKAKQEAENKAKKEAESTPKNIKIGRFELTPEQWHTLKEGGFIYLENMIKKNGADRFSSYVFLNDEKYKAFFSKNNLYDFVKYGKYEMRIRDKILIENGILQRLKLSGGAELIINIHTYGKPKNRMPNIRNHGMIRGCQKLKMRKQKGKL